MTAIICEYCSHETKYHSYNIDSFTGKKFDIYFCNQCLIAKTNLDKDFDLTNYYPKNYYGNEGKRFNILFEYLVLFARFLRSFFCFRLFLKKNVKLLDVGCGRGQFIYLLKKIGWSVFGTELSSTSASAAKKKIGEKFIFIKENLEEVKNININFDIITFWHVLEHLKNPKRVIEVLEKKLDKNGFFVIEVPNFDSYQRFIDRNYWILLECPRHVTHFTKKSLLSLFSKDKYNLIKISTFSLEYGCYGMLQSLLNIFTPTPNYLFSLIRSKNAQINKIPAFKNYISLLITILLFFPLLIISFAFELLAVLFKKGGVIRIVVQKNSS